MSVLTRSPISLEPLLAAVAAPARGGTCVFLGSVRGAPDEPVTAIEYSGYEAMVEAEAARILSETHARWPGARAALQHRVGLVPLGGVSVAIVVAAPHRAEAFEACRSIIEALKARVPIWKRELLEDGTATWVDPSGHPSAVGPA